MHSLVFFYLLIVLFTVVAGIAGADARVPLWMVIQILVVWAVKAVLVIVSYRRSAHA